MRVLLMHNPEAGKQEHEAKELLALLEKAGHEPAYQSTKKKGYENALGQATDLVLIAGGDGTVEKVTRRLVGRSIPFSILPLGTANNLARSLGFEQAVKPLISRLARGRRRAFDIGHARGPWGERIFFEAAGAGLLPDYLGGMAARVKKGNRGESLSRRKETARHVACLRRELRNYSAREWQVHLDGQDISGRFILLEAMNIRSIGPILSLAPDAETADGCLDFVSISENDRPKLERYLESRLTNQGSEFPVPAVKFQHLRIVWEEGSSCHFDDEIWPEEDEAPSGRHEIEIMVEPAALEIWQTNGKRLQ